MRLDGVLPRQELLHRQGVTAARLVEADQPAADRLHDGGLAPDHPAPGVGRRQLDERRQNPVHPSARRLPRSHDPAHQLPASQGANHMHRRLTFR